MGLQEIWSSNGAAKADDNLQDILNYIAGYLTRSYLNRIKCNDCEKVLASNPVSCSFLTHKDYVSGALKRPNRLVLDALTKAEERVVKGGIDLLKSTKIIQCLLQRSETFNFPKTDCNHPLKEFFLKHFFRLRIHHACKLLNAKLKWPGSCRKKSEKKLQMVARGILKKAVTVKTKKQKKS